MNDSTPVFGRRRNDSGGNLSTAPAPAAAPPAARAALQGNAVEAAPVPALNQAAASSRADIAELRALCLTKMDATAVAALPPERLLVEVERLLADIATERRIQLNGREQRQLAAELVDDMLGLGPLEPLLEDETITDIMVNGPDQVFVERRGKLFLSDVQFRDATHRGEYLPAHRRRGRPPGRREQPDGGCAAEGRQPRQHRAAAAGAGRPYISIRKFSKKPIDFDKLIAYGSLTPPVARILEIAGALPAEHHRSPAAPAPARPR